MLPINHKVSDDFVIDSLKSITDIAHIKDAKTKRYINCNASTLDCFGLQKLEDITGLTVKDLDDFMRPYWGDEYANQIDKFDYLVQTQREAICHKESTVIRNGTIKLQTLVKMPIIDKNNKVSSIFTITQDLTNTLELKSLYGLYKKHYSEKLAIINFMKYLRIDEYFIDEPTNAELCGLIESDSNQSIENNLIKLKSKIKNEDFSLILSTLNSIVPKN